MKVIIATASRHVARQKFPAAVMSRDSWEAVATAETFRGKGYTAVSGRSVDVHVPGLYGQAGVIEIDAPESQGGFLGTILEEVFGTHVMHVYESPSCVPAELVELYVEIDGKQADWKIIANDGWWFKPEVAQ
jgi:hypothetical protein